MAHKSTQFSVFNLFRFFVVPMLLLCLGMNLAAQTQDWTLIWSDNFAGAAGSAPNPNNWTLQQGLTADGAQSYNCLYGQTTNGCNPATPNVYLDGNNHLIIKALAASGAPNGVTSGRLFTSNTANTSFLFSTQYGRVEAEMVLPAGSGNQGVWPAFWMLGTNIAAVNWPSCGEMDIMEYIGAANETQIYSTLHGQAYADTGLGVRDTLSGGWSGTHIFGAIWSPNQISFYVDSITNIIGTLTPDDIMANQSWDNGGLASWPFNNPMFIILDLNMGGPFPGNVSAATTYPQILQVNYVNVYQATAPAPPTAVTPTANSQSQVTLNWTGSTSSDVTYNVYRSQVSGVGPQAQAQPNPATLPQTNQTLIANNITATTYTDANLSPGQTYYYTVTASGEYSGESAASQAQITTPASGVGSNGGAIYVSAAGYSGTGNYIVNSLVSGGFTNAFTATVNTSGVTNPAPQDVYHSERWGPQTWTIAHLTPGGSYNVRMHFAESAWTAAGQREFNVLIDGEQVLTNFDIFATAGAQNKVITETINAIADRNGVIYLQLAPGAADQPEIRALDVTPSTGGVAYGDAAGSTTYVAIDSGGPGGETATVGTFDADEDAGSFGLPANTITAGGATNTTTQAISTTGVTNPAPEAVYETERYGAFGYFFTGLVANSTYTVRLHMAEGVADYNTAGRREFNVVVNGNQVLTNYDIYANAGAIDQAVIAQVTGVSDEHGILSVQFTLGYDDLPSIRGIEVIQSSTPTAATPTFGPAAGTYTSAQTVTINDTTSGAKIYYTTNGTTPTTSSALYSAPITVSASETVEAIAAATGYNNSAVGTAAYTISTPTAATPTFSPAAGSYTSAQTVTISDTTPGAKIYYTTNGTTPTTSSALYSAPITVSASETVEAIAAATGYNNSAIGTAAYTITTTGGGTDILDISSGGTAAGSYVADEYVTGGTASATASTISTANVTNPAPQEVYQHQRYGNFTYTLPGFTAGTTYVVRLHFDEFYWTAAGKRTFNVLINGTQVLTNFDVFATAGGEDIAVAEQFNAVANSSGQIVIQFVTIVDNAEINGIEIETSGTSPAATPTFSPGAGTYTGAQTVTISDTTAGAKIYYTTNGTTPTTSSTLYSAPITVGATETLEAIAAATGFSNSAVATAAYTISTPTAATPTFSPAAGSYTTSQTVTISDTTSGAKIYYTTNGTTPTTSSTLYSAPITVSATETIQAIAAASGYNNSAIGTAAYTITAAGEGPYGGTPWAIPGKVLAENYDTGGQGVGYNVTAVNGTDNSYRSDGVDLEVTSATGGGNNIGWTAAGQWFRYTVNVATAGTYTVTFVVAAPTAVTDGFHLSNSSGTNLSGPTNVPATGGYQTWVNVTATVTLPAGKQVLTINQDNAGWNIYSATFAATSSGGTDVLDIAAGGTGSGSYVADEYFTGGTASSTAATISTANVTNPAPEAVYQSQRYGNFTYTLPGFTAGTTYLVRLHFDEFYWTAAGKREFNVLINGTQVLTNFDIFATAGGENIAVAEQFNAVANSSGQIVIQFVSVIDNAEINGIEIETSGVANGGAPAAPTGLTATAASSSQINLAWTASTTSDVEYEVFQNGSQISTVGTTTYSSTGLTASTTYSYTVEATDSSGTSGADGPVSATTLAGTTGATAPVTFLTAVGSSSKQIDLRWVASTTSAPNTAPVNYAVYRSTTPNFTPSSSNLMGTTIGITNYLDSNYPATLSPPAGPGVQPSTTYYYQVVASTPAGTSTAATASATSLPSVASTSAPTALTGLTAMAQSANEIDLLWNSTNSGVGTLVTTYYIYRSTAATFTPSSSNQIGTTKSNWFQDELVSASTRYYYQVLANNSLGVSPSSTIVSAATPALNPNLWGGAPFFDGSGIPATPAGDTLMVKFLNRTNGKYTDSQITYTATINGSTVDTSIAANPTYAMGANSAGRMYFFLNDPTGNEDNTDYWDFIEFTVGATSINMDTTRVDAFGLKIAFNLTCGDGTNIALGENEETFMEDRSVTFQRYANAVPSTAGGDFQSDLVYAPYRIIEPGAAGFNAGGADQNYYANYISSIWSFNGITIPQAGPNGSGLPSNPDLSAAIFRHTAPISGTPEFNSAGDLTNQGMWGNPASFYQQEPYDHYAQWIEAQAVNMQQYAFPYNDAGGYSSDIGCSSPKTLLVAIGW